MKTFYLTVMVVFSFCILLACGAPNATTQVKDHKQDVVVKKEAKAEKPPEHQVKLFNLPEEETPLPEKVIIDAPLISQLPELPNGCEVTSLAMLLQTAGVEVGKMTLAEEMPKVPFMENGVYGDPNDGFVGNMYHGAPGFGVYHGPVAALAKRYLNSKVLDITGKSWDTLEGELAKHHPVWVIINSTFNKLPPESFQDWHTKNGDIKVTMHEHSVLITGYDADRVYFNDPLTNIKNKSANKASFIAAWKQMGGQAISYK